MTTNDPPTDPTGTETTTEKYFCQTADNDCLRLLIPAALGGCIIIAIVIIVTTVVCLRRRKRRKVRVNLPNPDEIDLQPPHRENNDSHRQNQANETVRELPPIPTIETEQRCKEVVPAASQTQKSPQKSPQVHNSNYQNVDRFLNDEDDDDNELHDYENNPIERKKFEEDQRRKPPAIKKPVHGYSRTLQVGVPAPSPSERKTNSVHPTSQSSKLSSSSSCGQRDVTFSGHHSPGRKGYVNMSKSLENLEKRTVPKPPPLPSNPVIKIPSMERQGCPPKPHLGKSSGYINQPA